jgi:hypothetical protein
VGLALSLKIISFPNDLAHRISGIRNHFFDLRVADRLSRFRRDGHGFFRQVDLDDGHLGLLSKCLLDPGDENALSAASSFWEDGGQIPRKQARSARQNPEPG